MARARSTSRTAPAKPAPESKAQAEFTRYKQRVEAAAGPGAPFASPLPVGAIPAWSLQPTMAAGPRLGPSSWGAGPAATGATSSVVQGLGTTIRLSVDALNAALANSIAMMGSASRTWSSYGYGRDCGCGCNDCCGYDCCSVMHCGCGCCEPSVGTCCG
jgi:hypothetical protein